MKAFRSPIDDFDERLSIASTQSYGSMLGVITGGGWSYLSVNNTKTTSCSVSPVNQSDHQQQQQKYRQNQHNRSINLAQAHQFNRQQNHSDSIIQPYFYKKRSKTKNFINNNERIDLLDENTAIIINNNEELDSGHGIVSGNDIDEMDIKVSRGFDNVNRCEKERVSLIQRWMPANNPRYSQKIAKSISIDTPVSIAHV